jgi:hypothetical protein
VVPHCVHLHYTAMKHYIHVFNMISASEEKLLTQLLRTDLGALNGPLYKIQSLVRLTSLLKLSVSTAIIRLK